MKKLFFSLVILGVASLGYTQSSAEFIKTVPLKGITVSPEFNSNYRNAVQKGTVSSDVIDLENLVARYNLKSSPNFKSEDKLYKLSFRNGQGVILATFNRDGKILTSYEKFRNIAFPVHVRNYIYQEYPGWSLATNSYEVNYQAGRDVRRVYKSYIEKDKNRKTCKIVTVDN